MSDWLTVWLSEWLIKWLWGKSDRESVTEWISEWMREQDWQNHSSFVIHLSSLLIQLSLFTNAFLCFSFFLVFIVNVIYLSFTWWSTSFYFVDSFLRLLHWLEAFIWSSSWKNDPSLCSLTSQLIGSVSTFLIIQFVDLYTSFRKQENFSQYLEFQVGVCVCDCKILIDWLIENEWLIDRGSEWLI